MSAARIAVYPASFDPITNGHIDLIERASRLFDELIVAVAINVDKKGTFSVEERIEMIEEVLGDRPGVRIDTIQTLTVDYCRSVGARIVIRGLRALADFEEEFEYTLMNTHMYPDIEHVYLMTSEKWFYVSSSRLREIVRFGGDMSDFVPEFVHARLKDRLSRV